MSDKYTIKIENFEGPFDLLFHLIEKNKIDIYDIPIALITEQYIDYIESMQEMDLEVTSEFLVMAATLLHIKSRMLLPKKVVSENEEESVDPRDELVARLLEYKKYKEFAGELKEREKVYELIYYKLPEVIEVENKNTQLVGLNIDDLVSAFKNMLDKTEKEEKHKQKAFSQILVRDKVSVAKKIREISKVLRNKRNLKDIHVSYEEAEDSLKYRYLFGESSIIDMEDIILKRNNIQKQNKGLVLRFVIFAASCVF
jgi:segregation and condensation protein A